MSGNITINISYKAKNVPFVSDSICVEISWTADSADGSVPQAEFDSTVLANIIRKYCILAITDPGSPAPTDEYDIEILDEYGVDIFGGQLNNRDTADSEQEIPKVGKGYGGRLCSGAWTFKLTGNSVNSAQGKCILYFETKEAIIMAYTNKVAIVEGQEVFVVPETTPGTLVFPAAGNLVVATGDGSLNQNPTFTDSEEIANTRSILDSFQDVIPAGAWSIPTYIRPSGSAGDIPSAAAILEALLGTETIVGATSVTYSCAMSLPTFSIWVKKRHSGVDEGTVFFASGATADQLALSVTNKGAVKADFSGGFMELGWCGTDQLNGALVGAETDIVVDDAKKYCVGGHIKIGTDDNTGSGYEITVVNVSTETLTISPAKTGAADDDTTVAPFLPTGTKVGTVAENRDATLSVGGTGINFKSLDLTFANAIQYLTDEITTSEHPEDYAEGKRNVDGSVDIYLRHDDLQYFYDAMQNTDKAIVLTVDGGAGYIMTLTMDQCRLSVPVISSTAPTISLNIPYKAKASAGEDEIEIAFT